jgi:hypothetical protein
MERFSKTLDDSLTAIRSDYVDTIRNWIGNGTYAVTYPAYLVELYHIIKHSCDLMAEASDRLRNEHPVLANYLRDHIMEETGHEAWLLEDLSALGFSAADVIQSEPLPETIDMIGSQLYVVRYLHPAGLFGYIFFMEGSPPTDRFLEYATSALGIPSTALKALREHGERDIEHRRELIDVLDDHFTKQSYQRSALISAKMALSNGTRILKRIRSGNFVSVEPIAPNGLSFEFIAKKEDADVARSLPTRSAKRPT